jgi:hypothetical protein
MGKPAFRDVERLFHEALARASAAARAFTLVVREGQVDGRGRVTATRPALSPGEMTMRVKTTVKAGSLTYNHNETAVRAGGLKVQTGVKAGGLNLNHNQTQAGLKVQTGVKAGGVKL